MAKRVAVRKATRTRSISQQNAGVSGGIERPQSVGVMLETLIEGI
jgi:hypothetical protein